MSYISRLTNEQVSKLQFLWVPVYNFVTNPTTHRSLIGVKYSTKFYNMITSRREFSSKPEYNRVPCEVIDILCYDIPIINIINQVRIIIERLKFIYHCSLILDDMNYLFFHDKKKRFIIDSL